MTVAGSRKRTISAVLLIATLAACGGGDGRSDGSFFNPQEIPLETYSAQQLFQRGQSEPTNTHPRHAAVYFSENQPP